MSLIRCDKCGNDWEGSQAPSCPTCSVKDWLAAPGFLKPKHDPTCLPMATGTYRSTFSYEYLDDPNEFLTHVSEEGGYYFSVTHNKSFVYDPGPFVDIPGSGILAKQNYPDHRLDGILIADCFGADPHIYVVDPAKTEAEIRSGSAIPVQECSVSGCTNLVFPGESLCKDHKKST